MLRAQDTASKEKTNGQVNRNEDAGLTRQSTYSATFRELRLYFLNEKKQSYYSVTSKMNL